MSDQNITGNWSHEPERQSLHETEKEWQKGREEEYWERLLPQKGGVIQTVHTSKPSY